VQFIDLAAQQERIRDRVDAAIARVLDHGRYIMGPEVTELEAALAEFCGAPHAVSCASGTDALLLALMVRGVGAGDAVVVPSFTFASTAEAVALLGATPVFVDVEESTFDLDPDLVAAALDAPPAGTRVVGVLSVDLFGLPADNGALAALTAERGCWLVADAAQSFGATRDGVPVGRQAELTTTSFFPAKPLGCYGDGGAVFAVDAGDAEVLRSLRVHGSGTHKYDNTRIGINGRLDTLQAAILLEKLAVFPDELRARAAVADRYAEGLAGVADRVALPRLPDGVTSAWAQYTVRVPDRDTVAARLGEAGVPTAVYYPRPLHRQTAYRDFPVGPGGLAVSERLSAEVLSLPMHPYLAPGDQDRVVGTLVDAVGP
jgi:dTDP-4-amino-4,6-dideoxygalactose transaminase